MAWNALDWPLNSALGWPADLVIGCCHGSVVSWLCVYFTSTTSSCTALVTLNIAAWSSSRKNTCKPCHAKIYLNDRFVGVFCRTKKNTIFECNRVQFENVIHMKTAKVLWWIMVWRAACINKCRPIICCMECTICLIWKLEFLLMWTLELQSPWNVELKWSSWPMKIHREVYDNGCAKIL